MLGAFSPVKNAKLQHSLDSDAHSCDGAIQPLDWSFGEQECQAKGLYNLILEMIDSHNLGYDVRI